MFVHRHCKHDAGVRDATATVGIAVSAAPVAAASPDAGLLDRLAKLEAQLAQKEYNGPG